MEEYLEIYRNKSFQEESFNEVDALLFATIAYLPKVDVIKPINFNMLYNLLIDVKKEDMHGYMADKILNLIDLIRYCKRYNEVLISNIVKIDDEKVQFGAMTFRCKQFVYIAYEGSNSSISGWIENFMLALKYPTDTQNMATDYLKKNVKFTDKTIYVGGHSKGGNLAMVASMNVKMSIFKKIKNIYNFDGPGFRKEEYNSNKFYEMNKKCLNYLPAFSIVGILLYNNKYKYIKTNKLGIDEHYPINWEIDNNSIVECKVNDISLTIKEKINNLVEHLHYSDTIKLLEIFSKILIDNNIYYAMDVKKLNLVNLKNIFSEYNEIDEESKRVFTDILKLIFKV